MTKYYSDGGEIVYNRERFRAIAEDNQSPILVEGMKREKGGGEMWCKINSDFIDSRECCGNQYSDYYPFI